MKRKSKLLAAALAAGLALGAPLRVNAADYVFESGDGTDYHPPTEYEDVYGARYNYGGKNVSDFDAAELLYGSHSNVMTGAMEKAALPGSGVSYGSLGIDFAGIPSVIAERGGAAGVWAAQSDTGEKPARKTAFTGTASMVREDGSIGTLQIPSLGIDVKVWEGETTESMKKGVAHYSSTTGWDGNVGLCGHNRGARYVIGSIKDLKAGDTIVYTTVYGTRTYEVSYVGTISNTDWSRLRATPDNRITITTCLADQPSLRVVVQGIEK